MGEMGAGAVDSESIEFKGLTLTSDDAITFLKEQGESRSCPVCATNLWEVLFSPGEGKHAAIQILPDSERGIPLFLAVCQKCGYLRLFVFYQLYEWKKLKQAATIGPGADSAKDEQKGTD
jgi:hypothetical protein